MQRTQIRLGATLALAAAAASCTGQSTKELSHGAPSTDSMAGTVATTTAATTATTTDAVASTATSANLLARPEAKKTIGGGRGGGSRDQEPRAGVLTAAVWDDAEHWAQYRKFLSRAEESSWNVWRLQVDQSSVHRVKQGEPMQAERRALDMGFLVDATGSMGDELLFLKSELKDIVRRVRAVEPDLDVRLSVVFYRDRGDSFVTLSLPFTRNVDEVVSFISNTSADGGGDFPEDMNAGLEAIMRQRWSRDAVPQMLFLLADAPPQQYAGADYTYHHAIRDAEEKGIAIYPVAASGVDKPTEFLFRAMAVMTGGKYVFLTDDSGVGEAHEEPDISGYKVEKLNDLMVREIRSYVAARVGASTVAEAR